MLDHFRRAGREPRLFRDGTKRLFRPLACRTRSPLPRPVEQVAPPLFLRIAPVLDLQPPDACVVGIRETFRHDAFEIVDTHQFEEFAPPALDGERLGNDQRPLRNNALERSVSGKARRSVPAPEDIESDVAGGVRVPRSGS